MSPTDTPRRVDPRALRAAFVTAGLVVAALAVLSPYLSSRQAPVSSYPDESAATIAAHVGVGLSFLLIGVLAWSLRPDNKVGPLMALTGLACFGTDLGWISTQATFIVADEWRGVVYALLFSLLLIFPSGRLYGRADRVYVWCAFAYVVIARPIASAIFWDPRVTEEPGTPANPLLIHADEDLNVLADRILNVVDLLFVMALAALLVRRWRRTPARGRRALTPVLAVGALVVVPTLISVAVGGDWIVNVVFQFGLILLPVGFLVGLLRSQLDRAAVAELVVELQSTYDPAGIRAALARALQDPTLRVGYWVDSSGAYVDETGALVRSVADGDQASTLIAGASGPVALLVHDASLLHERDLLDAVCASARLALENQRLHAELRAQLDEVRASRARIVAAGDSERRRLERDLHDGAQQRLLAMGIALQLARANLPAGSEGSDQLLIEAETELREALDELRELAQGIHPAILTDGGLGPALNACAERTPFAVSVVVDAERFDLAVETAAYFVVSEALANAAKHAEATHARVSVEAREGHALVVIEDDGVGGASIGVGSGLRGLNDRVQSLGGTLSIVSEPGLGTRITAEIPCG